jgi:hypothetical protein
MFHQGQATDYIDLLVKLEELAVNSHVDVIVLNVGGTGWAVGDLFTINGGTIVGGHNAIGEVLTQAGGVALTVRIFAGGAYTVSPGVAATTTAIIPAVGINLTIDATILATGWATDRSQVLVAPERELLLRGVGSGADEIFIGFETKRNVASSVFYWELAGATGFDNGEPLDTQPGSSRGNLDTEDLTTPLNNGIIDFFVVIDGFHIKLIAKSGASYTNLYMGFIFTYATPAEYPYPLIIIGCSSAATRNQPFNTSNNFLSGMHDPLKFANADDGPAAIREVDGQWYQISHAFQQGASKLKQSLRVIYPAGSIPNNDTLEFAEIDRFTVYTQADDPSVMFGNASDTSSPALNLTPSVDSGGDIAFLWPTMLFQKVPSQVFLGELIDVHPVIVAGIGAVSEDTMTDVNGDVYLLFQNCNRTDVWAFFAIKRTF